MRLLPSLSAILCCGLAQAQLELQRILVNITTTNGSEFVLSHDIHDTRLYLSQPSVGDGGAGRYTMVLHSRDKLPLKVDVIRFNAQGMAEEHYDITDMTEPRVRPVTAQVIQSFEGLCPDIWFAAKQIKEIGLRKTTEVRRQVPLKVRRLLPPFATAYERIVYAAMGPFYTSMQSKIPSTFEMVPSGTVARRRQQAKPPVWSFSISGRDRRGRPAAMQASFGTEGMRMAIQSHQGSIRDLYNDSTSYKS